MVEHLEWPMAGQMASQMALNWASMMAE